MAPWGISLAGIEQLAAAGADDYKAIVCLMLDGGNDQENTVVPFDSASHSRYAAIRGAGSPTSLAVPQGSLQATVLAPDAALPGGRQYALHPNMAGMARLFAAGKAAVLLNVGPLVMPLTRSQYRAGGSLPPKLFSHADQRSTFQSAAPDGDTSGGYGGRMLDAYGKVNATPLLGAISVASAGPLFITSPHGAAYQMTVQGAVPISPAVVERGPMPSVLATLIQQRRRHVLEDAYAQVTRFSIATQEVVSTALGAYRPSASAPFLTNQLRLVAQVAAAHGTLGIKRQVFYVRHIGYDTHGGQLGKHPGLLQQVSDAIVDFQAAIAAAGLDNQVTLFTASDFGRTLTSNGDGTDHGWGSHHFIVGGAVKGRAIYGKAPPVSVGDSDAPEDQWHVGQGRLLPSTSVAQYMATLARWFGVPADRLADVIPDLGNFGTAAGRPDYPIDLGFMRA